MRVALFGSTGYVGSYLIDALLQAGMQPVVLVRPGHESRVRHRPSCEVVSAELSDDAAVKAVLRGADAAIYNIGILREFPERDITFEELHYRAAKRIMQAAERAGVKRFVLMSANGVKAEGTPYQVSKFKAEQFLAGTAMDWTVFRPSVIFGDPRGRNEFATQLARDIVASPLPAPLFFGGLMPWAAGEFALSPVHVEDVASAFVKSLTIADTHGEILPLGGPRSVSWRSILQDICSALGRRKTMIPVPALGVSAVAAILDRFESFPITRDQLRMLLEGNTCGDGAFALLDIAPRPFDVEHLSYLVDPKQEQQTWLKNAA
ncbi:MAG: NAD(P)H-binding protein [Sedimenticolaceae bacterium]